MARSKLVLVATGKIREYTIVGSTTNPTKYSGVTSNSSRVTDNFTWQVTRGDLRITSKQDSSMTAIMANTKTTTAQSYTVAQQDLVKSDTDSRQTVDPFGSQEAYLKWMQSNLVESGQHAVSLSTTDAKEYRNEFLNDFSNVKPLYIGTQENDKSADPIMTDIIAFGSDGNIYQWFGDSWMISSQYTALVPVAMHSLNDTVLPFDSDRTFAEWLVKYGSIVNESEKKKTITFKSVGLAYDKSLDTDFDSNGLMEWMGPDGQDNRIDNLVYGVKLKDHYKDPDIMRCYVSSDGKIYLIFMGPQMGYRGGGPDFNPRLTSILQKQLK